MKKTVGLVAVRRLVEIDGRLPTSLEAALEVWSALTPTVFQHEVAAHEDSQSDPFVANEKKGHASDNHEDIKTAECRFFWGF